MNLNEGRTSLDSLRYSFANVVGVLIFDFFLTHFFAQYAPLLSGFLSLVCFPVDRWPIFEFLFHLS